MADRVQPSTQFVNSTDVLIRVAAISTRPTISISGQTWTISPNNLAYKELQASPTGDLSHDKTEKSYRFIGDDGGTDSTFTNERLSSSFSSFFVRDNLDKSKLDEAMQIILNADRDLKKEVHVQIFKYLGLDAATSQQVYDATMYTACVMNFKESYPADDIVQTNFTFMSRGKISSGQYNAGASLLRADAPNAA